MAEQAKKAPAVRTRSRGQVSGILERYADAYRANNPQMDCRYVYDPTNKPELSGVTGRQASGYEVVTFGELDLAGNTNKEDLPVRVGDLVLMGISREERAALKAERDEYAKEQLQSVQREFYEGQTQAAEAHQKEGHTRPGTRPVGSVTIQHKSFEYDVDPNQRADES